MTTSAEIAQRIILECLDSPLLQTDLTFSQPRHSEDLYPIQAALTRALKKITEIKTKLEGEIIPSYKVQVTIRHADTLRVKLIPPLEISSVCQPPHSNSSGID